MEKTDLKTLANSFVSNLNDLGFKAIFLNAGIYEGKENKNKAQILKYLKSFSPTWFTTARVIDNVLNITIPIIDNSYDDGVYLWDESDIYHFEKYNMPLNDEFINHIEKKNV